jgi:hypothetical protein
MAALRPGASEFSRLSPARIQPAPKAYGVFGHAVRGNLFRILVVPHRVRLIRNRAGVPLPPGRELSQDLLAFAFARGPSGFWRLLSPGSSWLDT